jgi:hypothetical protein
MIRGYPGTVSDPRTRGPSASKTVSASRHQNTQCTATPSATPCATAPCPRAPEQSAKARRRGRVAECVEPGGGCTLYSGATPLRQAVLARICQAGGDPVAKGVRMRDEQRQVALARARLFVRHGANVFNHPPSRIVLLHVGQRRNGCSTGPAVAPGVWPSGFEPNTAHPPKPHPTVPPGLVQKTTQNSFAWCAGHTTPWCQERPSLPGCDAQSVLGLVDRQVADGVALHAGR